MARLLSILFLVFFTPALAAPDDDLQAVITDYWANQLREDPFSATSAGVDAYNDAVPAVGPQDQRRKAEAAQTYLDRLNDIDRSALDDSDRTNADLLGFILRHDVALAKFDAWRMPILADSGFHSDLGYIVGATPFRTEEDFEAYLTRLAALPAYIDQNIENMQAGLRDGFTQPQEILENIIPSFEAQVKDNPAAHPLYQPFKSMPDSISQRRQTALRRQARSILGSDVIPAFARALRFMQEEYIPGARQTVGANELPDGAEYYAALVRYYTTLDDADPEQIHKLGLKEVARIRREMDAVIAQTDFNGGFDGVC